MTSFYYCLLNKNHASIVLIVNSDEIVNKNGEIKNYVFEPKTQQSG